MINVNDLKDLREAEVAMNEDGYFVFRKRDDDGHIYKTYGPYNFGDAMRICWLVSDDYKREKGFIK